MAPVDLSQSNAEFRLCLRTQSGKCGVLGWDGTGGTDGDFPYQGSVPVLPSCLTWGRAQQPLHRLRGLGVGAEGVQSGLCWLCFHTAFPWREALPQQQQNLFYVNSLDLKSGENTPGVTASESPLCSIFCPQFQGGFGAPGAPLEDRLEAEHPELLGLNPCPALRLQTGPARARSAQLCSLQE